MDQTGGIIQLLNAKIACFKKGGKGRKEMNDK